MTASERRGEKKMERKRKANECETRIKTGREGDLQNAKSANPEDKIAEN